MRDAEGERVSRVVDHVVEKEVRRSVRRALRRSPEERATNEVLRTQYLRRKVQRALKQVDEGRSISLDEYLKDPG